MSEWRKRLNVFLGDSAENAPSKTLKRGEGGLLRVFEGSLLEEVAEKNLEGTGPTGSTLEGLNDVFLEESPQERTLKSPQKVDGISVFADLTSPWLAFRDDADRVWNLIQAKGTSTIHLIGDGQKVAHHFTASKPADLRELARRGLETFPAIKTLGVVPVLPETVMLEFNSKRKVEA
jgi:hypothetical protein